MLVKNKKIALLCLAVLSSLFCFSQNPVLSEESELCIADPEPKVFNGRVYVYGSKDIDGPGWCSDEYRVISSADLIHWTDHGTSFRLSDVPTKYMEPNYNRLWAPDLIKHPANGKYYLFFCFNHTRPSSEKVMVAESDSPTGPFKNARPVTIDGQPIIAIDPAVRVDDDGKAYLAWPFKIAQLDPNDYSKVITNTVTDVLQWMPLYDTPFEGPSLRKRGDIYYYIYIKNDGPRYLPDGTMNAKPTKMAYLTSKNPLGPYEYKGTIIENTDYPGAINIHGSLLDFHNQWYVFYHLPVPDKKLARRMCIEPITFDSAGRILPVIISSSGVKGAFVSGDTIYAAGAVQYSKDNQVRNLSRQGAKSMLLFSADSAFAGFRYIDFTNNTPKKVMVSINTDDAGGILELRSDKPDGPVIASFQLPDTKGKWQKLQSDINNTSVGKKTVFVLLRDKDGKKVSFEWMMFL